MSPVTGFHGENCRAADTATTGADCNVGDTSGGSHHDVTGFRHTRIDPRRDLVYVPHSAESDDSSGRP